MCAWLTVQQYDAAVRGVGDVLHHALEVQPNCVGVKVPAPQAMQAVQAVQVNHTTRHDTSQHETTQDSMLTAALHLPVVLLHCPLQCICIPCSCCCSSCEAQGKPQPAAAMLCQQCSHILSRWPPGNTARILYL